MKKNKIEVAKWLPVFILAIILIFIYKTIDNIGQITTAIGHFLFVISPLLYGLLFTYFLFIPHRAVERLFKKIKLKFFIKYARAISTILIFGILIFLFVFVLSFVLPILISNINLLIDNIPGYLREVARALNNLPADSIFADLDIVNTIESYATEFINAERIGAVAQWIMSFVGGIFNLVMGLVISLYVLLDRDRILGFFNRLNAAIFKREDRINRANKYFGQINKVLLTFIASKGLDSLINFVVATTILMIFQVPYALLLGLIAGAFNFIPYLGTIISTIIISTLTFFALGINSAIYVLICLLAFNQVDGNFIEPRIMKSSLKISPILVIIAVVIGGAYFGIVGMFLAVPVAVIIKQLVLEYVAHIEEEKANAALSVSNPDSDKTGSDKTEIQ